MPPPSNNPALHLRVISEPFFVVQLEVGEEIPQSVLRDLTSGCGGFFSVTRTEEEISVVGKSYKGMPKFHEERSTWVAIKIIGPLEHSTSLTGVLASLTAPLKVAKVPVFALSTWKTDYVLVPTKKLQEAIRALRGDDWVFEQELIVKSRL
ncbi:uncharacterized protein LACBIDRAFT_301196 [Laccaria bicolor S238N-H82]|uniref:Predicted protein n=1 Tax=Laccaria bicolor (strain S238N-H82 / ATCC MYA-4686) TaxID=486041 RepID=B0CRK6_LACBS|nr:uncharacterized protein LACBIDRAFT_301196 [Laccaria bicolor S238N-H82]EDR15219.1 predicted protein [Laccaria bicolor S238N-H82]|eukprot:XP_001873427.1 predicted protein [Laccaria bicolor S238N-H82]